MKIEPMGKTNSPMQYYLQRLARNSCRKLLFASLILIVMCMQGQAQNKTGKITKHFGISVFKEQVGIPFRNETKAPLHLGGNIFWEWCNNRKGNYQFSHILQTGYYYHADFNQVFYMGWKPKFEFRYQNIFNFHGMIGASYAHSFRTQKTYVLEGGTYKEKTDYGKPHFMPSIGVGAGLHFNRILNIPVEIFARYEVFNLTIYSSSIPLTLNNMTSIGLKYSITN